MSATFSPFLNTANFLCFTFEGSTVTPNLLARTRALVMSVCGIGLNIHIYYYASGFCDLRVCHTARVFLCVEAASEEDFEALALQDVILAFR